MHLKNLHKTNNAAQGVVCMILRNNCVVFWP